MAKRHLDSIPFWLRPIVFDALESSELFQTCQNVFHEATGVDLILRPVEEIQEASSPGKNGIPERLGSRGRVTMAPIQCGNTGLAVLEAECGGKSAENLLAAFTDPLLGFACEIAGSEMDSVDSTMRGTERSWQGVNFEWMHEK